MPVATVFLHGFGFDGGITIAGYRLTSATSTHEVFHQYQEYYYQITLVFDAMRGASYDHLFTWVDQQRKQQPVIKATRNYYRCTIDPIQEGDVVGNEYQTVTFHLIGHSYRQ